VNSQQNLHIFQRFTPNDNLLNLCRFSPLRSSPLLSGPLSKSPPVLNFSETAKAFRHAKLGNDETTEMEVDRDGLLDN
jgi:hypothetical protein